MDTKTLNHLGSKPLKEVIEKVGGWPGSDNWTKTDFNETLKLLMSKFNTFPFFKAYLDSTPWDPMTNRIQIDPPEFDIFSDIGSSDTKYDGQDDNEYRKYLWSVNLLLNGSSSQFIQDVFVFTSKLHQAVTPMPDRIKQRKLYQRSSAQELQAVAPAINWMTCLQDTFHGFDLNRSQEIIVHDMDYLVAMSQIISQVQNSSVLQGYMVLALMQTLSPYLDERFLEARERFQNSLHQPQAAPRWETCLHLTNQFFEPALSRMFIQQTVSQKSERLALDIFLIIKDALHSAIGKFKWMDKKTQKDAQKNLENVQLELGIPQKYKAPSLMSQNKVTLNKEHLLRNALQLISWSRLAALPPWSATPWSVYSYYSQRQKLLVIPAGLMQPPFFHLHYPSAVNFGGLGFIMAHELIHSLHDYVLSILWGETEGNPEEMQCLQDHYDTLLVLENNIMMNNSLRLLENMADSGGLYIAQKAYESWILKHHPETSLPDVALTTKELFYISYGQIMCGILSPEDLMSHLETNPHSPPALRVNGAVSNDHEFSYTFQCGTKAAMNPQPKCKLWS
ncbi:kell blood group glycoprotein [Bombina bombina]|uniref:kell blood group glycoprotein n=1 Tax=Bombina bombina TaxID=8345 RepID=UPI00235AA271|nr:kell blood group glycoprotein [Bombina bombina]